MINFLNPAQELSVAEWALRTITVGIGHCIFETTTDISTGESKGILVVSTVLKSIAVHLMLVFIYSMHSWLLLVAADYSGHGNNDAKRWYDGKR